MFLSLDFVYVPTADVDAAADQYVDALGAVLAWKVRGMGTVVACLRMADGGPSILLSSHLEGENPVLVWRVADYQAAVAELRAGGVTDIHELEIPHGPCGSFRAPGGQRMAVYELVRPGADDHFAGRIDTTIPRGPGDGRRPVSGEGDTMADRRKVGLWVAAELFGVPQEAAEAALTDEDNLNYGRAMVNCVNGEGNISPAERAWILGYLSAMGTRDEIVAEVAEYQGDLPIEQLMDATPMQRVAARVLVYDAIRACSADGEISDGERAMVGRVADRIGVSADEVDQLLASYRETTRIRDERLPLLFPGGFPPGP